MTDCTQWGTVPSFGHRERVLRYAHPARHAKELSVEMWRSDYGLAQLVPAFVYPLLEVPARLAAIGLGRPYHVVIPGFEQGLVL